MQGRRLQQPPPWQCSAEQGRRQVASLADASSLCCCGCLVLQAFENFEAAAGDYAEQYDADNEQQQEDFADGGGNDNYGGQDDNDFGGGDDGGGDDFGGGDDDFGGGDDE